MATIRVCDRCMKTPVDDDTAVTVLIKMYGPGVAYEVADEELCAACAAIVAKYAQQMKLGPDSVPGGVRRGRKSKVKEEE